jgi:hypothetical protein
MMRDLDMRAMRQIMADRAGIWLEKALPGD